MGPGRNLLFHRGDVDDSVGTYVTDYILGAICFVNFAILLWKIIEHRKEDATYWKKWHSLNSSDANPSRFLPWNWTDERICSVTLITYAVTLFQGSFALMAVFAGLTHQFLQEVEPEESWEDEVTWKIVWRFACVEVSTSVLAILVMTEQVLVQEGKVKIPVKLRKFFYFTILLVFVVILVMVIYRSFSRESAYNITLLFLGFVISTTILGISVTVSLLRCKCGKTPDVNCNEIIVTDKSSKHALETKVVMAVKESKHLICYFLFTWTILLTALISLFISPACSHQDAYALHNCPLPDSFNHNSVMHSIFGMSVIILLVGELLAIKTRSKSLAMLHYTEADNV